MRPGGRAVPGECVGRVGVLPEFCHSVKKLDLHDAAVRVAGTGGQVDFFRGANISKGGKGFVTMPSTAKSGTISRIVPMLNQGAVVTTSKNDVDHVVTEYGVAKLRGKNIRERALALISIAHPDFRNELRQFAQKMNMI